MDNQGPEPENARLLLRHAVPTDQRIAATPRIGGDMGTSQMLMGLAKTTRTCQWHFLAWPGIADQK
jgi:hypothetical protein